MDTTFYIFDSYINDIRCSSNKKHWKIRNLEKRVNEHISGLRLLALKKRGTVISHFCNIEANRLEKQLAIAKFGIQV